MVVRPVLLLLCAAQEEGHVGTVVGGGGELGGVVPAFFLARLDRAR